MHVMHAFTLCVLHRLYTPQAKYPNLAGQYQAFIAELVSIYSTYGIVTILDLHWSVLEVVLLLPPSSHTC